MNKQDFIDTAEEAFLFVSTHTCNKADAFQGYVYDYFDHLVCYDRSLLYDFGTYWKISCLSSGNRKLSRYDFKMLFAGWYDRYIRMDREEFLHYAYTMILSVHEPNNACYNAEFFANMLRKALYLDDKLGMIQIELLVKICFRNDVSTEYILNYGYDAVIKLLERETL
jgi:hypothetical protein